MSLKIISEAVSFLQKKTKVQPETGIILGTGLGKLVNEIDIEDIIEYETIPGFPVSTVETHHGRLIFGYLEGKPVVAMQGRFHYYEGYDMKQVTFPVRVMKKLGIKNVLISNAAGSLNSEIPISSLMILRDHINLQPGNPLTGENYDTLGPRFPDMSRPYDENLRNKALEIAEKNNIPIHTGVYVSVPGPNLETPAEYKFLRIIGADAVGMSTVPEVIVARHMGLPCFAVSVITDECFQEIPEQVTLEKVIEAAQKAEPKLTQLIKNLTSVI